MASKPLLAALALASLSAPLHAAEAVPSAPAPAAEKPGKAQRSPEEQRDREQRETLEHLRRLVSMSDAQIGRFRATLDNVEKIPAERRAELRKKIESLRNAPPEEREAFIKTLREKFGLFDEPRGKNDKPDKPGAGKPPGGEERREGLRNLLDKHFNAMPAAEGKAAKEKFLALPREEKIAYIKALREKYGLPPEPVRERKAGDRPDKTRKDRPDTHPAPEPPPGDPFRP